MSDDREGCARTRDRILAFYGRDLGLDDLIEVVGHLDGCPGCTEHFNAHGRKFGLIRSDFAEHLDPEAAFECEEIGDVRPLEHPVDVLLCALGAVHSARLAIGHPGPPVRFRGGPGGGPSESGVRTEESGGSESAGRTSGLQSPASRPPRAGQATSGPQATVLLGPAQLSVAFTSSRPQSLVILYQGPDAPEALTTRIQWSDGSTTEVKLQRGDRVTVLVPGTCWLAGLRLEE